MVRLSGIWVSNYSTGWMGEDILTGNSHLRCFLIRKEWRESPSILNFSGTCLPVYKKKKGKTSCLAFERWEMLSVPKGQRGEVANESHLSMGVLIHP